MSLYRLSAIISLLLLSGDCAYSYAAYSTTLSEGRELQFPDSGSLDPEFAHQVTSSDINYGMPYFSPAFPAVNIYREFTGFNSYNSVLPLPHRGLDIHDIIFPFHTFL